jgi:hypothetical protein
MCVTGMFTCSVAESNIRWQKAETINFILSGRRWPYLSAFGRVCPPDLF